MNFSQFSFLNCLHQTMEEEYHDHDHDSCNTTLRLGSNQNGIKRDINDSRVILDLSIGENEKERSKLDEEEIDFFKDFSRKKLRLSKDQTTLLEESFKQHSTLNTAQKQTLAGKLNLKPRQVEVWFQNRRARSKLKKTEVDCQFLKKHCERLSEENCRLKKELVELRSKMKTQKSPPATPWPAPQQCSIHVVKLERCPSCDKD